MALSIGHLLSQWSSLEDAFQNIVQQILNHLIIFSVNQI